MPSTPERLGAFNKIVSNSAVPMNSTPPMVGVPIFTA